MSKALLFVRTRLTSLEVRFEQANSRISRLAALFEPRHFSAAFWLQSKISRAASVHLRIGGFGLVEGLLHGGDHLGENETTVESTLRADPSRPITWRYARKAMTPMVSQSP